AQWVEDAVMMHRENDDARAVRSCFLAYQQAILEDDGVAAAERLDETSMQRYAYYRDRALEDGPAAEDSQTPLVDRLCVALFRLQLTPGQLRAKSPREIVAFAIDHGLIGKTGTNNISIGKIEVTGDEAC